MEEQPSYRWLCMWRLERREEGIKIRQRLGEKNYLFKDVCLHQAVQLEFTPTSVQSHIVHAVGSEEEVFIWRVGS